MWYKKLLCFDDTNKKGPTYCADRHAPCQPPCPPPPASSTHRATLRATHPATTTQRTSPPTPPHRMTAPTTSPTTTACRPSVPCTLCTRPFARRSGPTDTHRSKWCRGRGTGGWEVGCGGGGGNRAVQPCCAPVRCTCAVYLCCVPVLWPGRGTGCCLATVVLTCITRPAMTVAIVLVALTSLEQHQLRACMLGTLYMTHTPIPSQNIPPGPITRTHCPICASFH